VLLECHALAAARAARLLARGRVRAVIDRLTAVLLIGLGVRLATDHR
jgi:threonine/homoserine/homoserine lactone efflux protein